MRSRELLVGVGVGAVAVACCAGLPAVLALVAGATVVGLLGAGVGLAVLVGCAGAFVVWTRRRRADAMAPSQPGWIRERRGPLLRWLPES